MPRFPVNLEMLAVLETPRTPRSQGGRTCSQAGSLGGFDGTIVRRRAAPATASNPMETSSIEEGSGMACTVMSDTRTLPLAGLYSDSPTKTCIFVMSPLNPRPAGVMSGAAFFQPAV